MNFPVNLNDWPDWALLLALMAVAALWIAISNALTRGKTPPSPKPAPAPKPRRRAAKKPAHTLKPRAPRKHSYQKLVLIDGSNVIHWRMNEGLDLAPSLQPLHDVIALLAAENIGAGVIFDATAGYKLRERFISDTEFTALIPQAVDIYVVPKGTSADDYLIDMAQHENLRIISNDRFRDHPNAKRVTKQRGEIVNGQITLVEPRK